MRTGNESTEARVDEHDEHTLNLLERNGSALMEHYAEFGHMYVHTLDALWNLDHDAQFSQSVSLCFRANKAAYSLLRARRPLSLPDAF